MMLIGSVLNRVMNDRIVPYIPVYDNSKDSYIIIGADKYNFVGASSFESFEFKLTKRGGDVGKIVFSDMLGNYGINDRVIYVNNGVRVYEGFVQKYLRDGIELQIIPLWGLLDYVYITGTLELEGTDTVLNVVKALKPFIESVGIVFNENNIDSIVLGKVTITSTLAGRSVRDILEELEGVLPQNTVFGVNGNNDFYFKSFSEVSLPKDTLNWHAGDFSNSDYEIDYSEYIVKVKQLDSDTYNVLVDVVGATPKYPPLYFTDIVGRKAKPYELNFYVSDDVAYQTAYNFLKLQAPAEKLKLKTLNKDIEINKAYKITTKPVTNYFEDFNVGNSGTIISNNILGSSLMYTDNMVEKSFSSITNSNLLLSFLPNYINACDRSLKVSRIIIEYKSNNPVQIFRIGDGIAPVIKQVGNGAIATIENLEQYSKRDLYIDTDLNDKVVYNNIRVFFTQGSKQVVLNARNITYKYSNGILNIDVDFSKLNSVLTGYFFNEQQKIKKLEDLLTNKG